MMYSDNAAKQAEVIRSMNQLPIDELESLLKEVGNATLLQDDIFLESSKHNTNLSSMVEVNKKGDSYTLPIYIKYFNDVYEKNQNKKSDSEKEYKEIKDDSKPLYGLEIARVNKANKQKEVDGDSMNNDDFLKSFIDKINEDQREIKNDVREMEKRISQDIRDAESRNSAAYDRIEKMIESQNEVYAKNIERMEQKIDSLTSKLDENQKYMHTTNITLVLGAVATVLSIVAIGYGVISVITDILNVVPK